MTAPVFVTGLGVVAPNGLGLEQYWQATLNGRSGIGRSPVSMPRRTQPSWRARSRISTPPAHLPSRLLPQTDVSTRLALVAAAGALTDARVDPRRCPITTWASSPPTHRAGSTSPTANSKAVVPGPEAGQRVRVFRLVLRGEHRPDLYPARMRGPSSALVAEQAGGLDAIGHARRTVRRGTSLVVTGGVDSAFDPWGWVVPYLQRPGQPGGRPAAGLPAFRCPRQRLRARRGRCAPGAGRRRGGAGSRRAPGVRRDRGVRETFDPPSGSSRPPGLRRAAELALADAAMAPADIDVVFADAAAIPELDRAEAEAISGLFGPHGVPVTGPKALTGRLFSGGGPLDLVTAALSIRDGVIPPTAGTAEVPADYHMDLVRQRPRAARVSAALVLARGRWGFNSAVIIRKVRSDIRDIKE